MGRDTVNFISQCCLDYLAILEKKIRVGLLKTFFESMNTITYSILHKLSVALKIF